MNILCEEPKLDKYPRKILGGRAQCGGVSNGLNQSRIMAANPKSGPTPKWLRTAGGRKLRQRRATRGLTHLKGYPLEQNTQPGKKSSPTPLLIILALQGLPSAPTEGNCLVGKYCFQSCNTVCGGFVDHKCEGSIGRQTSPLLVRANQP